jgi:glutaminyl-tRNA synthetase
MIDEKAFNEACGVGIFFLFIILGVVISKEDIEKIVSETIASRKDELVEKRYQLLGPLLGSMKEKLRWANSLWVKEELDRQVLELLGPKDDRDDPKKVT